MLLGTPFVVLQRISFAAIRMPQFALNVEFLVVVDFVDVRDNEFECLLTS